MPSRRKRLSPEEKVLKRLGPDGLQAASRRVANYGVKLGVPA